MENCESKVIAHPDHSDWWTEYQWCIDKIEQTGDREVTITITVSELDDGPFGYWPCLELDVSVDGTVARTLYLGDGLDPVNNSPYTVKLTGLSYGDRNICVENLAECNP
jgi:hypothetical protein